MALKYQRILLKISGEALGGEKGMGFDEPTMDAICGGVKKAHELGVQIGIVVGGGNFWRGRSSGKMERTLADKIGMLATVMNALAMQNALEKMGVPTRVQSAIPMATVCEPYIRRRAQRHMEKGRVVEYGPRDAIFGAPQQAYTRSLLAALLDSDPTSERFRRRERSEALTAQR